MMQTEAGLSAKLDAIAGDCGPQSFLRLAATAKDFISVASALRDLNDESEFTKTFERFIRVLFRFYNAFQQAFDMGLLVGTDESSKSSSRTLRELDKALENEHRRLACIVAVCRLAEVTACQVGIGKFPNCVPAWTQVLELMLEDPIYAVFFQDADLSKWRIAKEDFDKFIASVGESSGVGRIWIRHSCLALIYEAGELWAYALTHEFDPAALEECAGRLRRLLNFLTSPAQDRWILQDFRSIGATDSMQAILREIVKYDIRRIVESDGLNLRGARRFAERAVELPVDTLMVTEGWLRKRKFVLTVPEISYFLDRFSLNALDEATENPVAFLRAHWKDAPRSLKVDHCRQQLQRIEAVGRDTRLKEIMGHALAHLTGETFAFAISSSVGTSPEVSIFIAGCFGVVVQVALDSKFRN